ncbi:ABC transporter ATP-binding protein [Flavobacterium pallidum]|uniref:ABC transporter ATP-binding protein n=1 Tax=Flavobacterium pallidum TaxID=2172098 RepID=A0A2S1SJT7_9FLAO|nr:ABC transporter ATP-binding protein [Flavobacterium pallidum]AWI26645.1 ABC transporter ATP-binding protein [Flavobacterium pallidum]
MKNENPHTENVVEVRNLYKGFGDMQVLDDLSFELRRGENLVILGKSGTGKSVTIKCIVRLLTADSGSINVLGHDVNQLKEKELNEIRQKIGFLFQSGALYDSMTVRQNLEFPLRRIKKDLSETEIEAKVKEALENVGLPEAIDKMPSELSGGMRKRISLARTIIVDPEIMLYDEPTTGLDPVTSHEISLLINDIQQKYKTSSIVITHDIECARTTANRMIMLKEGRVYKEGKPQEFEQTDDELINSYFQSQNVKNLKTT